VAVAKYKPFINSRNVIDNKNILSKNEDSIAIDNQHIPVSSIIPYVAGYQWNVDYYSQILNKNTDIRDHDYSQSAIYQQYNKIRDFMFKVTSPLESTQDQTTNEVLVTGSATMFPHVIPNTGDLFLADVGQGKYGIFRITNVERKSIHLESVYEINYSLLFYKVEVLDRFKDLESKVINTYYYHKDFVNSGQNPLLVEEDYQVIADISVTYDYLLDQYLSRFYSNQFSTILVPGQESITYDKYLIEYFLSIVDLTEHPDIKRIKRMNIDKEVYLDQNTIFTALKNRDLAILKKSIKRTTLVSTLTFNKVPVLDGIRYSGIKQLVYPDTSSDTVIRSFTPPRASIGNLTIDSSSNYPAIYPVNLDGFYVLSSHFYLQTETQSNLETMIRDYLLGKSIDHFKLMDLVKLTEEFTEIEYYYYIPLIMTLIKASLQHY
jgi:hypothetical protein